MQERHRSYNGSVKQRRAPLFTGQARKYVVQAFIFESGLKFLPIGYTKADNEC